ncbi:MAG: TusE/DsrC/DsvC family sulfur relay protein, partial [Burkholderiales bacterium]|nr:TusE/DsrC/DsvC family sulfur relay protein [Burkholderiales bacterium]
MPYTVNGSELETDDQGYLREPDFSDATVRVIAAAEGIALTDAHWEVVNYLRDQYREHGHTPNFRNLLKGMAEIRPGIDSKALYDLFPMGPA